MTLDIRMCLTTTDRIYYKTRQSEIARLHLGARLHPGVREYDGVIQKPMRLIV